MRTASAIGFVAAAALSFCFPDYTIFRFAQALIWAIALIGLIIAAVSTNLALIGLVIGAIGAVVALVAQQRGERGIIGIVLGAAAIVVGLIRILTA